MGEIISIKKYQDRKHNKQQSSEDNENIDAFLSYMASEVSKILNKPAIGMADEQEKQNRKRFEERYKNMLLQAPDYPESQIQYFAGVMSNFLPAIFHGEWKDRFNTYMDFSEFYLTEFDMAYNQYRSENQEYEKEYPFRFSPLSDPDTLENELHNCLQQIIAPSHAESSRERAEIIMWQACRLFELYHNMDALFLEENHKN